MKLEHLNSLAASVKTCFLVLVVTWLSVQQPRVPVASPSRTVNTRSMSFITREHGMDTEHQPWQVRRVQSK